MVVGSTLIPSVAGKAPTGMEVHTNLFGLPLMMAALSVAFWPLHIPRSGPAFTAHCDNAALLNNRPKPGMSKNKEFRILLRFTVELFHRPYAYGFCDGELFVFYHPCSV